MPSSGTLERKSRRKRPGNGVGWGGAMFQAVNRRNPEEPIIEWTLLDWMSLFKLHPHTPLRGMNENDRSA